MKILLRYGGILLLLFYLLPFIGNATHFSSGEIYYKWAPTPTDSSRYEIFVNWYRNNGGIQITQNTQVVCITSSCFPDISVTLNRIMPPPGQASVNDPNGGWLVISSAHCADPSDPSFKDISIHKFSGYVSLPGVCGDFKFTANAVCCRDISTNLAASPNLYLEVHLNNTLGENSSPEIINPPGLGFCVQGVNTPPVQFQQKAIDADGDSIIYRLVQPTSGVACGPGTLIPYDSAYTATHPIPSWTGWQINQSTGVFSLSPYQQGSYVVKIAVEDWRFDILTLMWINIGTSIREIMIPVTANCNFPSSLAFNVDNGLLTGTYTPKNLPNSAMDSLKALYQLSDIYKDSTQTTVPELSQKSCFETTVHLQFEIPVKSSSLKPTDFRLFAPDGSVKPITGIIDSSGGINTDDIYLELLNPLVINGNYLLQIRRGNDGNTILTKCGNEFEEFSVILVPVQGCPSPQYQINKVRVVQDQQIEVAWEVDNSIQNQGIQQYFGAWDLYVRENQSPWTLQYSSTNPSDRNHFIGFNGSLYPVDHNDYEFFVELRYGGEKWGASNYVRSILLKETGITAGSQADQVQLEWNHYGLIPANQRTYRVEYGHFYRIDSVLWQSPVQTNTDNFNLNIQKDSSVAIYAIRIRAIDSQGNFPNSESNWVLYTPSGNPVGLEEQSSNWIIPNILNPNGNGLNESFVIGYQGSETIPEFSLKVYTTAGALVFSDSQYQSRNNTSAAWRGGNLPAGMYIYLIEFKASGESQKLSGRLNLLR